VRRPARHPFFDQIDLGRGRVERRQLAARPLEASAVDFPFARTVVVVRSATTYKRRGETKSEARYYLSSAEPADYSPAQWHHLVRGHWAGVEIRNPWRRDAIWGEDRSRTRNPNALANLALLRNALLALLPEHYPDISHAEIHERLHSHPAAGLRVIRST
jgi:predicted transposase YbfD/YdcC